ncbi:MULTISPECIES: NADH-quinone oxidoreductase subunit L [Methylosinus]|uniref:NADH-quinone oxidoreductase subunit L n=1 Tax=Methylosinus trichosporium (strain ATCC 35070 / NCIMB 11131 / UNIQEM 75 / OB3b) TaxID=595536 RepID=A0A2D2CXE6_METT3|nr:MULTISPECIES: NADH-quinone oxidoreductase subunit L [Methylosinus]ATQ67373.1 NADH-quinone oxidoreductase subunit L [Methylosinus trichosporium OB3b]OBS51614.1 NADH-quinone oxidoreductase subunit L [Methylosinus sp. 3S-1]
MIQAIVFLPLIGFLIAGLFGRRIGARPSELVTTTLLVIAAGLSWMVFFDVALGHGHASAPVLANWFTSGKLSVDWALRVDTLTAVMLVVVNSVSALVHLYSIGYMHEDPHRPRFFAYLSLFTFAMLTLVTADNLVQMFFGWEGVGLASYLLIGFWYQKPSANAAAIKAFVVNRVGDFGFALGIFLVFQLTQSVGFEQVFAAVPGIAGQKIHVFGADFDALTLATFLLFTGAMGKSAQFLLHTWLPDAMEGPTPVSALIHAATMVTAGVFMVARLSPIFEYAPDTLAFVTLIGGVTAFFAATIGLVQNDIKRVIAYSTCSQLGYMFVAEGVGAYSVGVFHLYTHAFFKALLFLGAGSVIHAMHHEQDMRNMGGLWNKIPVTFAMMTIGTLALTGFPYTAGYFSKDQIIEAAYAASAHHGVAFFAFLSTVIAAGLTSFYSWRLVFMTFFGKAKEAHGDAHAPAAHAAAHGHDAHAHDDHAHDDHAKDDHAHGDHGHHAPHESPIVMLIPLIVLSVGALGAGLVFAGFFSGHAYEEFWKGAIYTGQENHILHAMHEIPEWISFVPTVMMALGFLVALYVYQLAPGTAQKIAGAFPRLYRFLLNKWYFDELYDAIFVRPAFALGRLLWKGGDGRIIDGLGPDGIAARVVDGARLAVRLQTGYVYHYAFAMLIGVAAFVTWFVAGGLR